MSSRNDSRIEAKAFLLTFSKFNKLTFLNFKLFWWILAIEWYVIIAVHYMAIIFCAKMSPIKMNVALQDFLTNKKLQKIPGLIKKKK